ncbi:MAG: hypothetical protein ACAF41_03505 [Leptolyngbya sp. BL-A-14]
MENIPDWEIESIKLTRSSDFSKIVDFIPQSNLYLLQSFIQNINWNNLRFFSMCAAEGVGCGFEVISSHYDDDLEPDEEPYTGVQITSWIGDEPTIVLSREAYESFCLRILNFADAVARTENQPILKQPVWSEISKNREQLKTRLETAS